MVLLFYSSYTSSENLLDSILEAQEVRWFVVQKLSLIQTGMPLNIKEGFSVGDYGDDYDYELLLLTNL